MLGSGYGGVLPLTNGMKVNPSAGECQAIPEPKYLPVGQPLCGVPLNQRAVTPFQTAPVYYQHHSYDVGTLLQQRSSLDYQYQKLQAFAACMYGGAAMMQQLPTVQGALQGYGNMPLIAGGDLLYRQPEGIPLSFGRCAGSSAPSNLQATLPYLQDMGGQMGGNAHATIQTCQPIINAYQSSLLSQLQHNSRQLSFHGYPAPVLSKPQSVVYPLKSFQQWLTSSLPTSAMPLTGYLANHSNSWPSQSPLFFAPSVDKFTQQQPVIDSDIKGNKSLENHAHLPMFKQRFDAFHYPVEPTGYKQTIFSTSHSASAAQQLPVKQWAEATGNRGVLFTEVSNRGLSIPAKIKAGPLGRCVEFMAKQASEHSHTASRESLTMLFNSWEGQVLFGNRDHLQGKGLLKNSSGNPQDYTSESVPVDIDSTLAFIDFYTTAIGMEQKPEKVELSKHREKKRERLAALRELRQFVAGLNSQDPDCAALCRLALQMCGRVRERSLVSQKNIPLCGGFAVVQNAWGENPLMTTRILLNLARYQSCSVKTLIPGKDKTLKVPPINLSKFTEALADKLLLSTLYDLNSSSSTPGRDAVNASFLGVSARPFNQSRWLGAEPSDVNSVFLQAMCQASNQRCPVRGAVTGKLSKFIEARLRGGLERKANKNNVLNIEGEVNKVETNDAFSHAVIFDSFKEMGDMVTFKLYSWGRVYHLKMKTKTFLEHIDKNSFVLFNQKIPTDSNSIFRDINVEVTDKKDNDSGVILSLSGEEIPAVKGKKVKGFAKKEYTYKGNGSWTIYN
ncbi:hypothetical protein N9V90_02075 [Endozoicomonas sp.]|nr:hypothetical protein [Endozoicomonas sp.]